MMLLYINRWYLKNMLSLKEFGLISCQWWNKTINLWHTLISERWTNTDRKREGEREREGGRSLNIIKHSLLSIVFYKPFLDLLEAWLKNKWCFFINGWFFANFASLKEFGIISCLWWNKTINLRHKGTFERQRDRQNYRERRRGEY